MSHPGLAEKWQEKECNTPTGIGYWLLTRPGWCIAPGQHMEMYESPGERHIAISRIQRCECDDCAIAAK